MSTVKNLAQLGTLIAARHDWAAAKAFKAYEMSDADRATLSKCAIDLLKVFPADAHAAAMMSAALAVSLESRMQAPIHVVAGTLCVEGYPVFPGSAADCANAFGTADGNWSGHVWVMVGPYVVDISIFRTAYSADGPARLARHVDLAFGPGKGLYVDLWKRTARQGLDYAPCYVLSADEVTALMGQAYHRIRGERPD